MTNKEYADSLRLLADHYEKHPELQLPYDALKGAVDSYGLGSKEEVRTVLRNLGSCKKEYRDDGYLVITKPFGALTLTFYAQRESVCERVVKERFTVVEKRPKRVEQPVAPIEYEEVAVEKEVVEWRCPEVGILQEA